MSKKLSVTIAPTKKEIINVQREKKVLTETIEVQIINLHKQIETDIKSAVSKAVWIGELLLEKKKSLDHGAFIPWIQENLPFDERQAQKYIQVYMNRSFANTNSGSHLIGSINKFLKAANEKTEHKKSKAEKSTIKVKIIVGDIQKSFLIDKKYKHELIKKLESIVGPYSGIGEETIR